MLLPTAIPLDGAVFPLKDTLLVQLPGNAAVIKPSEVSLHSSKVMEELLPLYLDKVHSFFDLVCVISAFEELSTLPIVFRRIYTQW